MNTRRIVSKTGRNLWVLVLAAVAAAACDSSSGPAVLEGRIVNTAIGGISFATPTQSGVTGADGRFRYLAGETITFSLGDTLLGSAPAKATLNWFELAGFDTIPVGYLAIRPVMYGSDGAPSLAKVGAIASLLTTIDDDRDSANGINISPAVAALFDGVSIDMDYASSPQYDIGFKRLLRHAVRDALISPRQPRAGSLAVRDVYDNHSVDPQVMASRRSEYDNDNDGQADWIRLLTYAPSGRVTRDYIDDNADGIPEIIVDLSYNAEAQGVVYAHDNNADGAVDRTRRWEYDAFGEVARYEEDTDGDGVAELTETRTINDDALWVRREVVNTASGVHTIEVWTADGDGNRTLYDLDQDGDGNYDVVVHMTYDEPLGPWVTRAQDNGRDGTIDEMRERTYDASGRLVRDAIDTGADGNLDWIEGLTRDSDGRITRKTRDTNGDGDLEYAESITYDAAGNTTRREYDDDGDGNTNRIYRYSFDGNGNITRFDYDNNADGVPEQVQTYVYNAQGDREQTSVDQDADGTVDRIYYNRYDANGYQVRYETDLNADGTIDRRSTYLDHQPVSIASYF